jgi:hypothetical protein
MLVGISWRGDGEPGGGVRARAYLSSLSRRIRGFHHGFTFAQDVIWVPMSTISVRV